MSTKSSIVHNLLSFFDLQKFTPKTIECLREGYTKDLFYNDLIAGLTVGVIALPLAMAFAIGSGVGPERGLFTAIIAGFLISLLGGTRICVGGPTGAYVVIIYSTLERQGIDGLLLATLLSGIILIVLGIARCGALIRFIPYPVITGFTTGIATIIFTSQIKDFCGLSIDKPSPEFLERLHQYATSLHTFNSSSFFIAVLSLAVILYCRKISKKIPGAIVAICVATLVAWALNLPCATIESTFGSIPRALPTPSFPSITLDKIQAVFPDAITIALLGGIESLLCAVIADGMTGFRHNSNCELVGQGIANLGSVIFGGLPATGAIARTTANIQMQARTPFAGMIHAVTLLLLMILLAPAAGKIPLAALASILIVVAWNMSEIDHFKEILKGPKSDAMVLVLTFALTVFIDLTVAVQLGVIMAAFLFLKHMSDTTSVKACTIMQHELEQELETQKTLEPLYKTTVPEGVEVFEIEGPFFFGVSDILNEALRQQPNMPKVFILRMRTVPLIDASGLQALKSFAIKCHKSGIQFFLCEVKHDVLSTLEKSSMMKHFSKEQIFPTLRAAIQKAKEYLT